ncbi:DMT family transporter [Pseudodonghicola flavimaris]|uniref:DMT family transporter n=1 Tax=Pseudodonghicola flavimaris TaxID=3050036 RepID=A0ABT7F0W3_9RHOB|nr:DMT family transporter [Pseudodonghicola flavimaris]MDK3018119.1 DMT family transporter [Pseudodonghicola flavimaris]
MTQTVAAPASSRPLHGVLWMLAAGLVFVVMTALVKALGPRIPAPQAAFLRYAMGLIFLLPMLRPILNTRFTPKVMGLFALRGLLHSGGVMLWFFAMTRIPLAELTALNYLSPIFVTIGAALFLKEHLAFRRIAAIGVALLGAVVILRPGFREIEPGHLAMLIAATVFSGSYLLAKVLTDQISPAVVVSMLSVWVTLGLAPFAAVVWVTPTATELLMLLGVACFATAGHYLMTLAMRAAPLTVTQPVTFLQLVWATLMGVLLFHESVDFWVLVGAGMILAAISFITWREAVLRRRNVTPPVTATKG